MLRTLCASVLFAVLSGPAIAEELERKPAPADARVYIISPTSGEVRMTPRVRLQDSLTVI